MNYLNKRIMVLWRLIIERVLKRILYLIFCRNDNGWRKRQVDVFCYSIYKISENHLLKTTITDESVEDNYARVSGSYIKSQLYHGTIKWSVINEEVKKASTIESARLTKEAICGEIAQIEFNSILEVGVGELNTLALVMKNIKEKIYYGVDLSLNRLCHGYSEFISGTNSKVCIAQANAIHLPFEDKSIDIVYTAHCLEQMPRENYKLAIDEMMRVARTNVMLFEPSYELGGVLQKLKMRAEQYVRGIPRYIHDKGMKLNRYYLIQHATNPFNRTALHAISMESEDKRPAADVGFACPICHVLLEHQGQYYICKYCNRLYFQYERIPVLDSRYAHYITRQIHNNAVLSKDRY